MQMKGIFIYYNKINKNSLSGIDKKVLTQIQAFNNKKLNCNMVVLNEKEGKQNKLINALLIRLPFSNKTPRWSYVQEFDDIDFLYFRRPFFLSIHTIKVLKDIRKRNPGIKVILEIPNYPYDSEIKRNRKNLPLYIKDKYNRRKLRDVVDRIAVQNDIENIFDIPTLKFVNGIDVSQVSLRKPKTNSIDTINICAVASLTPWQGYERIINGLNQYYKNGGTRKIIIHVVGEGIERKYYEELVNKFNLIENVIFYGFLTGKEIDEVYNISDLALDAFGRYKTNNKLSTSLKSREYLAKGLPIILGCETDIINSDFTYSIRYPNDDSIVDFNHIVDFYDRIYKKEDDKLEVSREIRNYAYNVCDISKTMGDIINYIKS